MSRLTSEYATREVFATLKNSDQPSSDDDDDDVGEDEDEAVDAEYKTVEGGNSDVGDAVAPPCNCSSNF